MKRKGVIEFLGFLHSQKKYNHDIELTAFQCDENSHIGTHYFGQLPVDSEVWNSSDSMGFRIWGEPIQTEIKTQKWSPTDIIDTLQKQGILQCAYSGTLLQCATPIVGLVQELQDMCALQAGRIPQAVQDTVEKIKWCLVHKYSWGMTLISASCLHVCTCSSCLSSHQSQQIFQYCIFFIFFFF